MHCVTWTYAAPPELTEPRIRQLFDTVAERQPSELPPRGCVADRRPFRFL